MRQERRTEVAGVVQTRAVGNLNMIELYLPMDGVSNGKSDYMNIWCEFFLEIRCHPISIEIQHWFWN